MLVLSRKSKERIQIGDNIVVTVLQIRGKQVRIGIDAPREIRVMRKELQKLIWVRPTAFVPQLPAPTET